MQGWTKQEEQFLTENYPEKGKMWCCAALDKTEAQVRQKTSRMRLKQNRTSDFFKDWQSRAAKSKIGKKRPDQSDILKAMHRAGKLKKNAEQNRKIGIRVKQYWKEHGHPRGMLGKKHNEKTLLKMGVSIKKSWANKTPQQLEAFSRRASARTILTCAQSRRTASWRSEWREIGEHRIFFRSSWEANYARYLQLRKERGEIKEWSHEPERFPFPFSRKCEGCASYLPDFKIYNNDGTSYFVEVKGWMDKRSVLAIEKMKEFFPLVQVVVVCKDEYIELSKRYSNEIEAWEHKGMDIRRKREMVIQLSLFGSMDEVAP